MKIVDVCAFYAPRGGGVRTYIDRKLAAAPDMGHEIVVVAPGPCDRIEERGAGARIRWLAAPLFPLDRNYRYFADRAFLHAVLDQERPDMVEVSSPWRSAAMVADWRGNAPLALIAHADPLSAYAYRWFGGIADRGSIDRGFHWYWRHLRRLDRRYDLIVSASASLSERLREGGLGKVVTNPMGVEAGLFSPGLRDEGLRARLLADCSLAADALLLVGVGRHSPEKRWNMIARAVAAAGHHAPIGLVLVGDGHARAQVVRTVGANPHIHLVAPIADRLALARLMASGDALIHGCEAETFCFVAAEAAASGLPIIAPDLGGASDHARASGGRIYRSGQAEAATRAILDFRRSPRPGPARAAPRLMQDHFDDLFRLYADLPSRRAEAA